MDAKRPLAAPRGSGTSSGQAPSKRRNAGPDDGDARFESFELDAEDMDERLMEEDLEVDIGEAGRNWERPPAPDLDPGTDSISEPPAAHEPSSQQRHKPFITTKKCNAQAHDRARQSAYTFESQQAGIPRSCAGSVVTV